MKKLSYFSIWILVFCLIPLSDSYAGGTIKQYFSEKHEMLQFEKVSQGFYSTLKAVGFMIAVIVLLILAISYITANGSQKAALKSRLSYYILGIIMLIVGVSVLGVYEQLAKSVAGVSNGSSARSTSAPAKPNYDGLRDDTTDIDEANKEARAETIQEFEERVNERQTIVNELAAEYSSMSMLSTQLQNALIAQGPSLSIEDYSELEYEATLATEKANSLATQLAQAKEDLKLAEDLLLGQKGAGGHTPKY